MLFETDKIEISLKVINTPAERFDIERECLKSLIMFKVK